MSSLKPAFWGLSIFAMALKLSAQVDGSNTEVSAAIRLKDYLRTAELPPNLQVLNPGDTPLAALPTIPGDAKESAEIVRVVGENMRAGSLQIVALVRIHQPGSYSFRTDLIDSQGKGLRTMVVKKLGKGARKIEFNFYGRAIRRHLSAGVFTVPGILGEKLPDDGGTAGKLTYYGVSYPTRPHHLSEFSDRVWDSPEKRAYIRALEREIAEERRKRPQ